MRFFCGIWHFWPPYQVTTLNLISTNQKSCESNEKWLNYGLFLFTIVRVYLITEASSLRLDRDWKMTTNLFFIFEIWNPFRWGIMDLDTPNCQSWTIKCEFKIRIKKCCTPGSQFRSKDQIRKSKNGKISTFRRRPTYILLGPLTSFLSQFAWNFSSKEPTPHTFGAVFCFFLSDASKERYKPICWKSLVLKLRRSHFFRH